MSITGKPYVVAVVPDRSGWPVGLPAVLLRENRVMVTGLTNYQADMLPTALIIAVHGSLSGRITSSRTQSLQLYRVRGEQALTAVITVATPMADVVDPDPDGPGLAELMRNHGGDLLDSVRAADLAISFEGESTEIAQDEPPYDGEPTSPVEPQPIEDVDDGTQLVSILCWILRCP